MEKIWLIGNVYRKAQDEDAVVEGIDIRELIRILGHHRQQLDINQKGGEEREEIEEAPAADAFP